MANKTMHHAVIGSDTYEIVDEQARDGKSSAIYCTTSGNLVTIPDGADSMPLKSLTVDVQPVQAGTGDPSPENIRPISGWTCKVYRTGKNLQPPFTPETKNGLTLTANADGSFTLTGEFNKTSSNYMGTSAQFTLPAGTYYINGALNSSYQYQLTDVTNARSIYRTSNEAGTVGSSFTLEQDTLCASRVYINYTSDMPAPEGGKMYPMIRCASDADFAFIPYQGQVYPIISPPGTTVYGGTLNVITGTLTVDRLGVDLGTLDWTKSSSGQFRTTFTQSEYRVSGGQTTALSSSYKLWNGSDSEDFNALDYVISVGNGKITSASVAIRDSRYSTTADFKSGVSGQTVVYELATPITITIDPTTIRTLLGLNNIWADTGAIEELTYAADTKMYIEELTKPSEDDLIANSAIEAGKFFMIGNRLFLSTASIANGATITPGTNATELSLSEALNSLA